MTDINDFFSTKESINSSVDESLKINNDKTLTSVQKTEFNIYPEDYNSQKSMPVSVLVESEGIAKTASNPIMLNQIETFIDPVLGIKSSVAGLGVAKRRSIEREAEMQAKAQKEEQIARQEEIDESWLGSQLWRRARVGYKQGELANAKWDLIVDEREGVFNAEHQDEYNRIAAELEDIGPAPSSDLGVLGGVADFASSMAHTLPVNTAVSVLQGIAHIGVAGTGAGNILQPAILSAGAVARGAYTLSKMKGIMAEPVYSELIANGVNKDTAFEYANIYGNVAASVEAGADALFLGLGKATKQLSTPLTKTFLKKIEKELIKKLAKNELLKASGELTIQSAQETMEEVFQQALQTSVEEKAYSDEELNILRETSDSLLKMFSTYGKIFKGETLTPEEEDIKKTTVKTFGSAFILGGAIKGVGASLDKAIPSKEQTETKQSNVEQTISDIKDIKAKTEKDIQEVLQRVKERSSTVSDIQEQGDRNASAVNAYMDNERNSELREKDEVAWKEVKKNLRETQEIPSEVYMDTDTARAIIEESQTDNSLAASIIKLDLNKKLEEAESTGNNIAIDAELADDVIFNPADETLYQKVKDGLSLDKDTLSVNIANQYVKDMLNQNAYIEEALQDKGSIASQVFDLISETKSPEEAISNSILAQNIFDNLRQATKVEVSEEEFLNKYGIHFERGDATGEGLAQEIVDIDTPKFKKWFRDSKVIDNGKPIVLYHGTDQDDINIFDRDKGYSSTDAIGSWFGNKSIAKQRIKDKRQKGKIYPVYLSIKNPLLVKNRDDLNKYIASKMENISQQKEIIDALKQDIVSYPNEYKINIETLEKYRNKKESFEERVIINKIILDAFDVKFKKELNPFVRKTLSEFDGVIVEDDMGYGKSYVAFSSQQVKSIYNNGDFGLKEKNIYKSRTKRGIAGEFIPSEMLIRLTKAETPTSFMHEFSHFSLHFFINEFNEGNLKDEWFRHISNLAKWGGVEIINGKLAFKTTQQKTKFQEKVAEAMEQYLATGKAPVARLDSLFAIMKSWIMSFYSTIRGRKLPSAVTEYFDRLLMTEAEAVDKMNAEKFGSLLKPDNFTQEAYDDYISNVRQVVGKTSNKTIKAIEKLAKEKTTDVYKEKLKENYDKILSDLNEDRRYDARNIRIDPLSLEGKIPADFELKKQFLSKSSGVDAEWVVNEFGFEDVSDLVIFLNESKTRQDTAKEIAENMTENWIKEQYPELRNLDVNHSIRDEATIKAQLYEAMMLKGISSDQFNAMYNELVLSAEKNILATPLTKMLRIQSFLKQISNATELYRQAERNGDKNRMAQMRYRCAVLNYMALRSNDLLKRSKKFTKHFKRYKTRPSLQQLKYMDGRAWDIINGVLYAFGFTKRKPANTKPVTGRILDFVDDLSKEGFTAYSLIENNAVFLGNPDGINNGNLTVSDFDLIDTSLRYFESVAKKKSYIYNEGKLQAIQDAVEETKEHFVSKGINAWNEDDAISNRSLGKWTMKETLLSRLLPRKVFVDYVLPFMEGLTNRTKWITEKGKQLADILKPVFSNKKVMNIDGRNYTYENLFTIMINSGNDHNRKCMVETLRLKYGEFTDDNLQSILNQSPKELRAIAQKVWNFFEENISDFVRAQEKINGKQLKMVEPTPVVFSDGETLTGGYYPATEKFKASEQAFNDASAFKNDGLFPTYYFQKDRTNMIHGDLDLTTKTLEAWVYKMAGVINVGDAHVNLYNLLHNNDMKNLIGDGALKSLRTWLGQSITPERVDKTVAVFDTLGSVAILGWKPIKAVIQTSGIIPAMSEVGVGPMSAEIIKFMVNPFNFATVIYRARKLSNYMDDRFGNPENHLADVRKMSVFDGGKIKKGLEAVNKIGMFFVMYGDAIASYITWNAQYNKSISEGLSIDNAVREADSVVRRVQGDTSAGSRPELLQGNLRFFNKFASYFIGIHSIISSDIKGGRRLHAIGMLAAAGVLAPFYEAIISSFLEWNTADDEDKRKLRRKGIKNLDDYMKYRVFDSVTDTTASTIIPAWGIGLHISKYAKGEKIYQPTLNALTTMYAPVNLVIDLSRAIYTGEEKDYDKVVKDLFISTGVNYNNVRDNYEAIESLIRRM